MENAAVKNAILEAEEKLGENGRVLVRKSGTEKLIRVMIEGKDEKLINELADFICSKIQ